METVLAKPAMSKAYFLVENISPFKSMFLYLHGKLILDRNGLSSCWKKIISETKEYGPLFVNKGKRGTFIYTDGAVRKLLDKLNLFDVDELVGLKLPVVKRNKGFWVINMYKI